MGGPRSPVKMSGRSIGHTTISLTCHQNNYFTEMCSGSEEGSYLRLIDFCITQL